MIALGLDSGGSRTRLAVRGEDGEIRLIEGSRGNVAERGPSAVARTVAGLVRAALKRGAVFSGYRDGGSGDGGSGDGGYRDGGVTQGFTGLEQLSGQLVMGAAGVGPKSLRDALKLRLRETFPRMRVEVLTDPELAMLTTFGQSAGTAIVLGTGSAIIHRRYDGSTKHCGGWGATAGDVASGHWLGRNLLAHVAECFDGLVEQDSLSGRFCREMNLPDRDSFKLWLRTASRSRQAVASVAPFVLEDYARGGIWSSKLCTVAAEYIARLLEVVLDGDGANSKAVLVGGVVEGDSSAVEAYRRLVSRNCMDRAGVEVVEMPRKPVEGALLEAERLVSAGGSGS